MMPHTLEEETGDYFAAPTGLPVVQHALPALMELVHDGVIDLPTLVAKTSHRVPDLFGIVDRGYLREGGWRSATRFYTSRTHHALYG